LLWLGAKGYRNIEVLRRTAARGRREVGGADFIAESAYGPHIRIAIQLRHWRTPVQRRAVDELWGFMLRHGIPQGLIITNNSFYPRAMAAALEFPGRPIQLISASRLAGSMAALGLGVEADPRSLAVSEPFFRMLSQVRLGPKSFRPFRIAVSQSASFGNCSADGDHIAVTPPEKPDERRLWWLLLFLLVILLVLSLCFNSGGQR
jgi:hypothetical protein